jgi:AraC-like DNA-binding protein
LFALPIAVVLQLRLDRTGGTYRPADLQSKNSGRVTSGVGGSPTLEKLSGLMVAIPALHFDTDDHPENQRFDIWRAGIATHVVTREGQSDSSFEATVDAWTLGDLVVTHSRIGAVKMVRSIDLANRDGRDWILILFLKSGSMSFSAPHYDQDQTLAPGELGIYDMSLPSETIGSAMDVITCVLSRRLLSSIADLHRFHGVVVGNAWGRLIADCLLSIVRQLPHMCADDAGNLVTSFTGLLTAAMKSSGQKGLLETKPSSSVRTRVEHHVNGRLGSKSLTPVQISNDLGISKPSLYRAFAHVGGVAAYVRKRRLETIHALLNGAEGDVAIGQLARQYGFVSAAHFSRAFKRQFGFVPRSARSGAVIPLVTPQEPDEIELFRLWEEHLR